MSLALARKHRPKRFADVAVQSHVATTLRNAIANDRVANAYFLRAERYRKTTLARVLAMALNCENRRPTASPAAPVLRALASGPGPPRSTSPRSTPHPTVADDARELRERAMYAPSGDDRYKVYIIDEAHMLTREAWNALLKVLEEPPPRVVFVFATTEPQKIAQAAAPVLSRVQRFDLKRIGPADVRERLAAMLKEENVGVEPDALGLLARGRWLATRSLADQIPRLARRAITAQRVRDALGLGRYVALLDIIADHRCRHSSARWRLADRDPSVSCSAASPTPSVQLAIVLGGSVPDLSDRLRAGIGCTKARFAMGDLLRMLVLVG
jgi:DNA polymerase-3 subunit gamma/tau